MTTKQSWPHKPTNSTPQHCSIKVLTFCGTTIWPNKCCNTWQEPAPSQCNEQSCTVMFGRQVSDSTNTWILDNYSNYQWIIPTTLATMLSFSAMRRSVSVGFGHIGVCRCLTSAVASMMSHVWTQWGWVIHKMTTLWSETWSEWTDRCLDNSGFMIWGAWSTVHI